MSYEKIKISGLAEMEWLKLRKSGIGGSDVGAILGLNKYSSPMKVYKEKTTDAWGASKCCEDIIGSFYPSSEKGPRFLRGPSAGVQGFEPCTYGVALLVKLSITQAY